MQKTVDGGCLGTFAQKLLLSFFFCDMEVQEENYV